jgi:protein-S-isoprenylcysteine O-methyltransferase Ste14
VTIYRWLIVALWLIFLVYWVISAFGAKRTLNRRRWGREAGLRLIIIAIVLLALRVPVVTHALRHARGHILTTDPRLGIAGVTLCALGVGLAMWARVYLGRNWGLPMSRKEQPELVTSGPYAFVRHPIYTGILLAILGSVVAETILWLIPLAFGGAYLIYSARSEERLMVQEFPEQYPAYQRRTKMLVPFLL